GRSAQVVPLPVPGPGAALAPVLLHIAAADQHLAGGGLVEPGEIPPQHTEVRAHGQGQGDVVVLDNAAVGTDGHVDAGLGKIPVPLCRHIDDRRGLAPADAFGLPGDADG
ncbi:Holin, partial [Dysosmobacter welbionis]